jgi:hypothetical protein
MTVVEKTDTPDQPVAAKAVAAKPPTKPAVKAVVKTSPAAKKPAAPAKTTTKPTPKPAAKPAAKAAPAKPTKAKKPKMIRDSFTFPKAEYAVLDGLKIRAAKLGSPVKKTELLRAGIKAIAAMQDASFVATLKSVPSLKTGRPAKVQAD